jgi:hypothetical protein
VKPSDDMPRHQHFTVRGGVQRVTRNLLVDQNQFHPETYLDLNGSFSQQNGNVYSVHGVPSSLCTGSHYTGGCETAGCHYHV